MCTQFSSVSLILKLIFSCKYSTKLNVKHDFATLKSIPFTWDNEISKNLRGGNDIIGSNLMSH